MKDTELDFIAYNFDIKGFIDPIVENCPNKDKTIAIQLYENDHIFGSFFSCIFKGSLRIHIVFSEDSNEYNEEITKMILDTIKIANTSKGKIWISNQNGKIISYLEDKFQIIKDSENFVYESHELIMPREKFHYHFDDTMLTKRPYEEEHLDEYLQLLHYSMSFKIPPYHYIQKKEYFKYEFRKMKEQKNTFEAFWIKDELVGLYWLSGTEVDHLVVDAKYQRLGYGKEILTRAIEVLFQNPKVDYAWLLVVGWNIKAFNFYKKFGMEEKAIYFVPYKDTIEKNS